MAEQMIPDMAVDAAPIAALIAAKFEREGENSGEIITRWQNAEVGSEKSHSGAGVDQVIPEAACSWHVGPVWKLGGETCVCKLRTNHPMPHECTCGAWFEGCGAR